MYTRSAHGNLQGGGPGGREGRTHASLTAMTAIFWLVVVSAGVVVPMGASAAQGDRQDKRIFHTSGFRDAPPRNPSISCWLMVAYAVIWRRCKPIATTDKTELLVKLEPD